MVEMDSIWYHYWWTLFGFPWSHYFVSLSVVVVSGSYSIVPWYSYSMVVVYGSYSVVRCGIIIRGLHLHRSLRICHRIGLFSFSIWSSFRHSRFFIIGSIFWILSLVFLSSILFSNSGIILLPYFVFLLSIIKF